MQITASRSDTQIYGTVKGAVQSANEPEGSWWIDGVQQERLRNNKREAGFQFGNELRDPFVPSYWVFNLALPLKPNAFRICGQYRTLIRCL